MRKEEQEEDTWMMGGKGGRDIKRARRKILGFKVRNVMENGGETRFFFRRLERGGMKNLGMMPNVGQS